MDPRLTRDYTFPSNSDQPKPSKPEERESLKPVVKNRVSKAKKTLGVKLLESFNVESPRQVGEHILNEVIIPGIKNVVIDVSKNLFGSIHDTVYMMMWGTNRNNPGIGGSSKSPYVSYNSIKSDRMSSSITPPKVEKANYNTIEFASKIDAENVLDVLQDRIEEFRQVSIADFYDIVGMSNEIESVHYNYGWKTVAGASIKRVGSGHIIVLPQPVSLK